MEILDGRAFLVDAEWQEQAGAELGAGCRKYGELWISPDRNALSVWARNTWLDPRVIRFGSIAEGARQLADMQRNWKGHIFQSPGRTRLLQEALPALSDRLREFPFLVPDTPMGGFTLLDDHTMIAAPRCTSPFPDGILRLKENRIDPPSSAYRKLQEALCRGSCLPGPGDLCVDAGASPGGWTWVLLGLGARVIAVDRSPLDPRLDGHANLEFRQGNAFSLGPGDFDGVDWLCSDVICYPARLLEWARTWMESGKVRTMILTVKMQGKPDPGVVREFRDIPGSRLFHGSYNKHELTWILDSGKPAPPHSTR